MQIQKRFGTQGLQGMRVCDIGSGTGFTGIIGAALGAQEATLTDQTTVQALLEENIRLCSDQVSSDVVQFAEFDWDASPAHLSPPFDLILVSDCVLPKLYPIEPLVKVLLAACSVWSIFFEFQTQSCLYLHEECVHNMYVFDSCTIYYRQ